MALDGPVATQPPRALRSASATNGAVAALNPHYTFEQFVIGASNRFAHAAAMSVAEKPAASYNPLFIYGDSGLGKTHLLHAVGHHLCQLFPSKRVRYVTTEIFMNEFVEAIRTNSRPDFKRRYREVDLLLVDDVQFMQNHERLQEEFFHTFDSLHGSGSQLVLSSDRPPKAMATLEDRLRTRFEWGLQTDIQPPEYETRLAILRHKARAQGFNDTPDEVLSFIATHITDNVRELEGALIRVAAYASLTRITATEDLAREVLADDLRTKCSRVITPQVILDETAKMFGWTIEDLCGRSRRRPLVTARQIGMYVFRELTDYSYPQIAREFGGRDHTTVMHAVEKITDLMAERRQIYEQVSELINRIKSGRRARDSRGRRGNSLWRTLWTPGDNTGVPAGADQGLHWDCRTRVRFCGQAGGSDFQSPPAAMGSCPQSTGLLLLPKIEIRETWRRRRGRASEVPLRA